MTARGRAFPSPRVGLPCAMLAPALLAVVGAVAQPAAARDDFGPAARWAFGDDAAFVVRVDPKEGWAALRPALQRLLAEPFEVPEAPDVLMTGEEPLEGIDRSRPAYLSYLPRAEDELQACLETGVPCPPEAYGAPRRLRIVLPSEEPEVLAEAIREHVGYGVVHPGEGLVRFETMVGPNPEGREPSPEAGRAPPKPPSRMPPPLASFREHEGAVAVWTSIERLYDVAAVAAAREAYDALHPVPDADADAARGWLGAVRSLNALVETEAPDAAEYDEIALLLRGDGEGGLAARLVVDRTYGGREIVESSHHRVSVRPPEVEDPVLELSWRVSISRIVVGAYSVDWLDGGIGALRERLARTWPWGWLGVLQAPAGTFRSLKRNGVELPKTLAMHARFGLTDAARAGAAPAEAVAEAGAEAGVDAAGAERASGDAADGEAGGATAATSPDAGASPEAGEAPGPERAEADAAGTPEDGAASGKAESSGEAGSGEAGSGEAGEAPSAPDVGSEAAGDATAGTAPTRDGAAEGAATGPSDARGDAAEAEGERARAEASWGGLQGGLVLLLGGSRGGEPLVDALRQTAVVWDGLELSIRRRSSGTREVRVSVNRPMDEVFAGARSERVPDLRLKLDGQQLARGTGELLERWMPSMLSTTPEALGDLHVDYDGSSRWMALRIGLFGASDYPAVAGGRSSPTQHEHGCLRKLFRVAAPVVADAPDEVPLRRPTDEEAARFTEAVEVCRDESRPGRSRVVRYAAARFHWLRAFAESHAGDEEASRKHLREACEAGDGSACQRLLQRAIWPEPAAVEPEPSEPAEGGESSDRTEATPSAAKLALDEPEVDGALEVARIEEDLRERRPQLAEQCAEALSAPVARAGGRVTFELEVAGDGSVGEVRIVGSEIGPGDVVACLREELGTFSLAAPTDGEPATVRVRMRLGP